MNPFFISDYLYFRFKQRELRLISEDNRGKFSALGFLIITEFFIATGIVFFLTYTVLNLNVNSSENIFIITELVTFLIVIFANFFRYKNIKYEQLELSYGNSKMNSRITDGVLLFSAPFFSLIIILISLAIK